MTTQETQQFSELTRRGQETLVTMAQAWAETIKQVSGALPQLAGQQPDVAQLVDQSFAFARQLLDAQQEVTRTVLQAMLPAGGDLARAAAENVARFADGVTAGTSRIAEEGSRALGTGADATERAAAATTESAEQTATAAQETATAAASDAAAPKSEYARNLAAGTGGTSRARKPKG